MLGCAYSEGVLLGRHGLSDFRWSVYRRGDVLVNEQEKRASDPCQHANIALATTCSCFCAFRHCDGVAGSAIRAESGRPGMDPRTASPGLAGLGRRVGASERTLSRLFRDEVATGYTVWRNQVRLHMAPLMLAGGRTVTQTASARGWSSPSAFVTTFRADFGQTPGSLYREGRRQAGHRRWTSGMVATG